ncbi:hypothetical protein Trydic_g22402 [Trypoxylus dichotomus]
MQHLEEFLSKHPKKIQKKTKRNGRRNIFPSESKSRNTRKKKEEQEENYKLTDLSYSSGGSQYLTNVCENFYRAMAQLANTVEGGGVEIHVHGTTRVPRPECISATKNAAVGGQMGTEAPPQDNCSGIVVSGRLATTPTTPDVK